jgi:uncharacterized protein (TIGR01370 family)
MKNKSNFKLIQAIALAVFCCIASQSNAFSVYFGKVAAEVPAGIVVLEPDHWSRHDLQKMQGNGVVPVAWLNLTQFEDYRLLSWEIKEKDLLIKRSNPPEGGQLLRFYSDEAKKMLKFKVREYLQKGFAGIFLARPDYYKKVSNNPINRLEMRYLIDEVSVYCKRFSANSQVLLHNGLEFYEKGTFPGKVTGVVVEGLFNGVRGTHKHPWDRKEEIVLLKDAINKGYKVFCLDGAKARSRKDFIKEKCEELGFKCFFVPVPLKNERK